MNASREPEPARRFAVAMDVGGTAIRAGLVDENGAVPGGIQAYDSHSNEDAATIIGVFVQAAQAALASAPGPVAGIGIATPGPFDYERGVMYITGLAKYEALYGMNLAEAITQGLGPDGRVPIRFINDAVAFALGEWAYGAARPWRRVMALTLGSGCGAAFLQDGRVLTSPDDGAPEGGVVFPLPCRDSIVDDWISRRGLLRLWREEFQGRPGSEKRLNVGGRAVDVLDLALAAKQGNQPARELFLAWGELMATALGGVIETFQPECLLIGGRIGQSFELFGSPLEQRLQQLSRPPKVVLPSDLPSAGVRGAAYHVFASCGITPGSHRPCPGGCMTGT